MKTFLKLYEDKYYSRGWNLSIYHSSIVDWTIQIGYKTTHPKYGELIIDIQESDMDLAFAKAQVELKKWLLENEEGY